MKITFFGESKSDDVILRHLIEGILEEKIEEKDVGKKLQFRSSSHLVKNLPVVIRSVHYNSDAEFLVIASDSDDTPVHIAEHDINENEKCHICLLRKIVDKLLNEFQSGGQEILKIAVGVSVPAIEAWLLFGKNPHVSENYWIRFQNSEKITYTRKKLKKELYGGEHIPENIRIETAKKAIQRIVENDLLSDLENAFPQGFGSLSNEVKTWKN